MSGCRIPQGSAECAARSGAGARRWPVAGSCSPAHGTSGSGSCRYKNTAWRTAGRSRGIQTKSECRHNDRAFAAARWIGSAATSGRSHPSAQHGRGGIQCRRSKEAGRYDSIAKRCSSRARQQAHGAAGDGCRSRGSRHSDGAHHAQGRSCGVIPRSSGRSFVTRHAPAAVRSVAGRRLS